MKFKINFSWIQKQYKTETKAEEGRYPKPGEHQVKRENSGQPEQELEAEHQRPELRSGDLLRQAKRRIQEGWLGVQMEQSPQHVML